MSSITLVVEHVIEVKDHIILEIENIDCMVINVALFDLGFTDLRNLRNSVQMDSCLLVLISLQLVADPFDCIFIEIDELDQQ